MNVKKMLKSLFKELKEIILIFSVKLINFIAKNVLCKKKGCVRCKFCLSSGLVLCKTG